DDGVHRDCQRRLTRGGARGDDHRFRREPDRGHAKRTVAEGALARDARYTSDRQDDPGLRRAHPGARVVSAAGQDVGGLNGETTAANRDSRQSRRRDQTAHCTPSRSYLTNCKTHVGAHYTTFHVADLAYACPHVCGAWRTLAKAAALRQATVRRSGGASRRLPGTRSRGLVLEPARGVARESLSPRRDGSAIRDNRKHIGRACAADASG